jgi:protoheme IX farnesyltransferase
MKAARFLVSRLRAYLALVKSLQTGLLVFTGVAGFVSARCPITGIATFFPLLGSLFLAVAGTTVLNMVLDRDIDQVMHRTCRRPLPVHQVSVREAAVLGLLMSGIGLAWAYLLNPVYGTLVTAGIIIDLVIYTIWLKRRTAWSFLWGGLAGGMPILAGRALGAGQVDAIGILLMLTVLCWIPTHIVTFSIKYSDDYASARIPVLPNVSGLRLSYWVIRLSAGFSAVAMALAAWRIGLEWGYFYTILILGAILVGLAVVSVVRRSPRLNFALFKAASMYMLAAMLVIILGV